MRLGIPSLTPHRVNAKKKVCQTFDDSVIFFSVKPWYYLRYLKVKQLRHPMANGCAQCVL
jgi:hypothetical protein